MAARKMKAKASKRRIGRTQIPIDKGWEAVKYYFHLEMEKKDLAHAIKTYAKNTYNKSDAKSIFANPEYCFTMYTHHSCTAFWINNKLDMNASEKIPGYIDALKKYCDSLISKGKQILDEKAREAKVQSNVVVLSPQQRLQKKIGNTIMQDLMELEDEWIEGEKTTRDIYSLFKKHGLPASATLPVRSMIDGWLLDYEDAYHKRCPQAVEGYSHLKRPEINRRIKACQDMLMDLDRIKSSAKATRKIRVKKPVAADKQVARVQFCQANKEFKLTSINPIMVIGQTRLFTFNVKTRILTEYLTQSPDGFTIGGSTLKGIDMDNSRCTKLRKPEQFLSVVLGKTPNQIDKEWKSLTTKTNIPNGRINKDTILLRVLDR